MPIIQVEKVVFKSNQVLLQTELNKTSFKQTKRETEDAMFRIPKKAISTKGIDPYVTKRGIAPKRTAPKTTTKLQQPSKSIESTTQKPKNTQKRKLLLRRNDDTSDESDSDINIDHVSDNDKDDSDSDDNDQSASSRPLQSKPPPKTKLNTSKEKSKRPRPEFQLVPKRKRRRKNSKEPKLDENGYAVDCNDGALSPSPRKKQKKMRFCDNCNAELSPDYNGIYCGDSCKKEGSAKKREKNRLKKAAEKAEKERLKGIEEENKATLKEKKSKQQIRKRTSKRFGDIFDDAKNGKNLERRIYKAVGSEIGDAYNRKVKELAYNLEKNKELLSKVLSGQITLSRLSQMNNDELARSDLMKDRREREEKFKEENTLQNKMVFGKVVDGKQFLGQRDDINDDKYGVNNADGDDVEMNEKSPTPSTVSTVSNNSPPSSMQSKVVVKDAVSEHLSSPKSPNLSIDDIVVTKKKEKVVVDEKKEEFDAGKMTQLLKICKKKVKVKEKTNINKKLLDDVPLKIERDVSTDDENENDEDDGMNIELPPPPPPPSSFDYRSDSPARNVKNVWNGTIHRVVNDKSKKVSKSLDLSFKIIGGKEVKLKAVIPKILQINGRLKFKDISSCVRDLVKVSRSKFTVILSAKCVDEKYVKEYKQIIKECRSSHKALMIDMKKTKAKIKLILLPTFSNNDDFDIDAVQKLWKCKLSKSENIWALLTVYKDKESDKRPSKSKTAPSKPAQAKQPKTKSSEQKVSKTKSSQPKCSQPNSPQPKKSEPKVKSRDRHSGSDKERNSDRETTKKKERHRRRSTSKERGDRKARDRSRDRDRPKDRHRDGERKDKDRDRDRRRRTSSNGKDRHRDDKYKHPSDKDRHHRR